MKSTRSALLVLSALLVVFTVGGGLSGRVGAGENSYRQVVLFSEILGLVLDNYVDPVDADDLLTEAYEGLLAGLDAQSAYLDPAEAQAWRSGVAARPAGPGISVLKAGAALQVVAVEPGSPAAEAGISVGDQVRTVDDRSVRDLSLVQAWRRIHGAVGTPVRLEVLQPGEGFRRVTIELDRVLPSGPAHEIEVRDGIAVLRLRDLVRADADAIADELDDVRSRGVDALLIDVRNVTDLEPRRVASLAGLFAEGTILQLRDRSGRLTEQVDTPSWNTPWKGSLAVLVNGATAGASEALAALVRARDGGLVLGESTYGLGAEPRLFALDDGSALLVPAELWETGAGEGWHAEGVEPDEAIRGRGRDFPAVSEDQLQQALKRFAEQLTVPERDAGADAEAA